LVGVLQLLVGMYMRKMLRWRVRLLGVWFVMS
jgi:hypothetical protein